MEDLIRQKENEINNMDREGRPLAYRMRPETLDSFAGQPHLLNKGKKLRRMIESGKLFSIILFGPPGCGKSALANIISNRIQARVEKINAVKSSVKDIRIISETAEVFLKKGKRTLLIIDEIHRFNRTQQESLLPDVEEGLLTLVGLTTENPFYFISGPLLSRASIYQLKPLGTSEIIQIINNAATDREKGLGKLNIKLSEKAVNELAAASGGDARYALNILELAAATAPKVKGKITIDPDTIEDCIGKRKQHYDRAGDEHYNTISAFIKSMRGSDPDAAVLYLAKMIASGEDPRFIARRIAICASEDIGNADPMAVVIANAALNAVEYVGMPEARIILSQAAVYLACAPKSNASCKAINSALSYVENNESFEIPRHLTKAGAKAYRYPHSYKYGYVNQEYKTVQERFYFPVERGHERNINKYLSFIRNLKKDEKRN